MALIPPTFLDTVVAIGFGERGAGDPHWAATGFLYGKRADPDEPIYTVGLVTNRHVFEGQTSACLRFNPVGGEPAKRYWIDLFYPDGSPIWASDANVDLAVVAIRVDQLVARGIKVNVFRSDFDILPLVEAEKQGVSEGDGVFALGFPMGMVGEDRNYAIVRHGAIARIRDAFIREGRDILVDVTVFPGNSGGPVVTKPEIVAVLQTTALARCALLGVVSGYVPYRDEAVSPQTGQLRVVFEENSGLTSVVPVDHVTRLFDANLAEWERRGVATVGPVFPPRETA